MFPYTKLCNIYKLSNAVQKRPFFGMLSHVFNKPDDARIKEVGPDLACAEWLLRCGARVKWKNMDKWHKDYNTLQTSPMKNMKIEEVNVHEAAVMTVGFVHFRNVEFLRKIRFYHCPYLTDEALYGLHHLSNSLEHLQIVSCGDITDKGLMESVKPLQNLQHLYLHDLPELRKPKETVKQLEGMLPQCSVSYGHDPGLNAGREDGRKES